MGTADDLIKAVEAKNQQIVGLTTDISGLTKDLQAEVTELETEVTRLERALAECEAGQTPEPGPEPEPDNLALPPVGKIYLGCSYNGMQGHLAITGNKYPHISHDYARSGNEFASRLSRVPTGCIPLINFKPAGAMGRQAYLDIIAGKSNASIDVAADAMKAWTKTDEFFFAPIHEPENDGTDGDKEYAQAFRFIVERVRARGATPTVVWNMMGFEGHGSRYNALYPGDDVVDWIASDPYVRTSTAVDTWKEFMDAPSGTFPGFYSWAKPKNKPFMLAEWGIGIAVKDVVAPKLLGTAQMGVLQSAFPLCRALVYWNEVGTVDYRLQNFPTQWKAFTEMTQFQF